MLAYEPGYKVQGTKKKTKALVPGYCQDVGPGYDEVFMSGV